MKVSIINLLSQLLMVLSFDIFISVYQVFCCFFLGGGGGGGYIIGCD